MYSVLRTFSSFAYENACNCLYPWLQDNSRMCQRKNKIKKWRRGSQVRKDRNHARLLLHPDGTSRPATRIVGLPSVMPAIKQWKAYALGRIWPLIRSIDPRIN